MTQTEGMTGGAANPAQVSAAEWIASGLGALVVLATLGFLLYRALWGGDRPPAMEVSLDTVVAVPSGHLARFTVRNVGDHTGAQVKIQGTVERPGEPIETRETTLDYVPAGSQRSGGLYFTTDPDSGTVTFEALSYTAP